MSNQTQVMLYKRFSGAVVAVLETKDYFMLFILRELRKEAVASREISCAENNVFNKFKNR
jgi:hypothetical protein